MVRRLGTTPTDRRGFGYENGTKISEKQWDEDHLSSEKAVEDEKFANK